ncbi:MAG: CarD family transcriptional regulator [Clostridia bacterium]|nr:CarD family transcriptional regulator [Clostridia bacterium]MBQ3927214.1 CarD family transcriptional regulator [Clostridia bacterium]
MFSAGEYIVYGTSGVCEIIEICKSPFSKEDLRDFYLLHPIKEKQELKIYTPVDNPNVMMRKLMDKAALEVFVQKIPEIQPLVVPVEKNRRDIYRQALSSTEPEKCMSLLKTVHARRAVFAELKRRLPETDLEFEELAKESLFRELSIVLDIPFSDVNTYITKHVDEA